MAGGILLIAVFVIIAVIIKKMGGKNK